jgi:hypothetical protein
MKKYFLIFALLILSICAHAQRVTIVGTTYDGLTQRALAHCVVSLRDAIADTLLVQAQTALQEERIEENGSLMVYQNAQIGARFILQLNARVAPQGYVLTIEKDKYERIEKKISAESLQKGRLDLGDFYLLPKRKEQIIKEVVVKATKIQMYYKGDTLIYDADAFNVSQMDKLRSLVAQLPAAEFVDGVLKVKGRVIENLTLSGKDFFNGNIQTALDNLPAFVVSKIKVYEKAGEMSELTGRDMFDKTYVMDIKLKREYIGTWLAKLQVDGGTNQLWGTQGMLMRMDERQMFTANFDANNLNEKREMSDMCDSEDLFPTGRIKRWSGKVNYFYEPNQHWRLRTEAQFERQNTLLTEQTYRQTFLAQRNLISRSVQQSEERQYAVDAFAALRYRLKKQQHELQYTFRYGHRRKQSEGIALSWYDSTATKGWANQPIDTLYTQESNNPQTALLSALLNPALSEEPNQTHTLSLASAYTLGENVLKTNLRYHTTVKTLSQYENFRLTHYTPLLADWRRNYLWEQGKSQQAEYRAEYIWKYGGNERHNGGFTHYIEYKYSHGDTRHSLYRLDWDNRFTMSDWSFASLGILPEGDFQSICTDHTNSYYAIPIEHRAVVGTQFNHHSKTSQGHVIDLTAKAETFYAHRLLAYERNAHTYNIQRHPILFAPSFTAKWEEAKTDSQNWHALTEITYQGVPRLVNLLHLLPVRDDSDPNNISLGNPQLKNAWEHHLQWRYQNQHRTLQHLWQLEMQWRHIANDFAMLSAYNSRTGQRTYTPQNTDCTHWLEGSTSYAFPFSKASKVWLTAKLSGDYYQGEILSHIDGAPLAATSLLQSYTITPQLYLTASIGSKFRASALWSSALQHVRQSQTTNNYSKTQFKVDFTWQLPYGVELQSNINTLLYAGYAERSLNQTSIRWDSSLRKYFELSRGTLAVSFKVSDILNQANFLHTSLDQFSRTEVYTNIMPRYALLSLVYMIDWTSKKR